MLLAINVAWSATTEMPIQLEVDRAFALILKTQIGKSICRDILGADANALTLYLGISPARAAEISQGCVGSEASEWVYPSSPADIRKLTIQAAKPRRYRLVHSDEAFPIESWTDAISNETTILTHKKPISFSRLVQTLAHETAVYFDSKSHPLHPGAQELPHWQGLIATEAGKMNPLLAVSNPLQAHTLTYLRALQVEFAIMHELVSAGLVAAPNDLSDEYLLHLVSERCTVTCIEQLIINTRAIYMPFGFPLIAFLRTTEKPLVKLYPLFRPVGPKSNG